MKRFYGMMPINEIEIEKTFRDSENFTIVIQAGKNGWTIIWADESTTFKDEEKSTDENFKEAYQEAINSVGELIG